MNRWFLDENDIDIYLKCADDVRWYYNKKELVRILNDLESEIENWRTMYKNVVQTCHNDKEEIKKLKKQNDDYADSLTKVLNENANLVFKFAEKDEQLKNAIVLNLKVGQEVYVIENKNIFKDVLEEIEITEDGITIELNVC